MLAFLKPYTLWIAGAVVATVVGAFGWLWVDNALTHSALRDAQGDLKVAEQTIKAQERAIEAVNSVEELRTDLNRALRRFNAQIMEAEGANEQIPPAVADVWGTGIDSLRSHGDDNSGQPEDLPTS